MSNSFYNLVPRTFAMIALRYDVGAIIAKAWERGCSFYCTTVH